MKNNEHALTILLKNKHESFFFNVLKSGFFFSFFCITKMNMIFKFKVKKKKKFHILNNC